MSVKTFAIGITALMGAMPVAAQQRGTMEFGAYGIAASFDSTLSLKTGYGAGGRVGMFIVPRVSFEFEGALLKVSRPNGLHNVNMGILSARLVAVPLKVGSISFLLGAGGGVSTETNFMHTYGADVLVGVKFPLGENVALRVDGVWDWLANEDWKSYKSIRAGLSFYRHPAHEVRTVVAPAPPPTMMQPADSVSAAETRRLRERDAALRALRDSLRNAPVSAPPEPSPATVATMQARIHFAFDKSEITDSAKAILDEKVEVFRANPEMTIAISGYTDLIGTDAYNMALGERRANASKAYLVSRGIDGNRITVESKGQSNPITDAPGVAGQAPNRRAIFRLLIVADPVKQ